MLLPRLTDIEAAPKYLLQIIKCGCKGDCDSQRITCQKMVLLVVLPVRIARATTTTCRNDEVVENLAEDDYSVC